MKILITGGTGFIGSHIVMELLKNGHQITILTRNPHKIPYFENKKNIKLVKGSLEDRKLVSNHLVDQQICIHNALCASEGTAINVLEKDTFLSVFLAEKAAQCGVNQFIYTSSTSVNDQLYQTRELDGNIIQVLKQSNRHSPKTFYGATKSATENYLEAISFQYKMNVNIVRPGYVFGNPVAEGATRQPDNRFYDIINKSKANEDIEVLQNDGTQFIWAGDLAVLYNCICLSNYNQKRYFGLSKDFISWEQIAKEAIRVTKSKSRIIIIPQKKPIGKLMWDTNTIKEDFDLEFHPWEKICQHLKMYL
ncbi:MAG: NAD(P)-dependent oxidoreductase [Spirochaetales bacterium]|nr:NAD(P)-dependent oxidoreductase [Spirochaetales bacterium]